MGHRANYVLLTPWMGPAVLARLPELGQAPDPAATTPDWGLHIDRERRRVGWWTAAEDVEVLAPLTSHTHVDPPDRYPDAR